MNVLVTNPVIKLIIVDDHKILKEGVKTILSLYKDIKVIADAENGMQLLKILTQCEPDIILLDLQMPVMDGLATLPEIRKTYPNIKIIIFTMHNDQPVMSRLLKMGAHSYLLKDSDSYTIYSTIKACYQM
jgi:DNA-binding NarL/FixJ family response regulator